jgi:hypothetical protein
MAKFGSNIKMTASPSVRDAMRAAFEGPLGCTRQSPNDTIDLFAFEDGASVAVDYLEAVLTPEQHKAMGTWIEFAVDDEEATAAALEACDGVSSFSFVTEHRYFQLPSGQVFRLKR